MNKERKECGKNQVYKPIQPITFILLGDHGDIIYQILIDREREI
jgi:hypothetical protein